MSKGWMLGVVALCGLALFVVWHARTPPAVGEGVAFSQLPPREQERRRAATRPLKEQLRSVAESARRKEHKPFSLTASEQQLNTLLPDNIRTSKFQVRDLHLALQPDTLVAQGRINYAGFDAVATINGNVTVRDGKLLYQVRSLQVGGLPAPASLQERAQRTITEQLNKVANKAPGRIDRVIVEQGQLTIEGVTD